MQIELHVAAPAEADRRFTGVQRLYGAHAFERFARARVAVVGLGGVGSWAAEALARSGVGRLRLIDLDHVAESNINRQVHALDASVGRAKVDAMAERIAGIDPGCAVERIDDFLTPDNCAALLAECDAVIDAVDDVRAKCAIAVHAHERSALIHVVCGATGGKRDPSTIRITDLAHVRHDRLLARMRHQLRRHHGFARATGHAPAVPMGVRCVVFDEPSAPLASVRGAAGAPLNCAGYGSVIHMTAVVGLFASGAVLESLSRG